MRQPNRPTANNIWGSFWLPQTNHLSPSSRVSHHLVWHDRRYACREQQQRTWWKQFTSAHILVCLTANSFLLWLCRRTEKVFRHISFLDRGLFCTWRWFLSHFTSFCKLQLRTESGCGKQHYFLLFKNPQDPTIRLPLSMKQGPFQYCHPLTESFTPSLTVPRRFCQFFWLAGLQELPQSLIL